jgi:asparagine synthase (glutamine-hydrolysing)
MCVIAGIVGRQTSIDIESSVTAMVGQVRHRSPDIRGRWMRGRVALGHGGLAASDLPQLGYQPMAYADDRYVITYNGAICNGLALRSVLEALGFAFRSRTDTEVILAAYAAWGPACLARFNGMWAFTIYDRDTDVIFAARDRFGIEPFYYVRTDTCFAFGSEIGQLLPLVQTNPGPGTNARAAVFGRICTLLPGYYLCYDVQTDRSAAFRYYHLLDRVRRTRVAPEQDPAPQQPDLSLPPACPALGHQDDAASRSTAHRSSAAPKTPCPSPNARAA